MIDHLRFFGELRQGIAVYGEEYTAALKLCWYQLVGCALKGNPISMGSIRTDTRVHVVIAIPSGKGKKNFKLFVRNVAQKMNWYVAEPTSFHPEQLVGKNITREVSVEIGFTKKGDKKFRREKQTTPNPGHFKSDLLIFDEASELFGLSKSPNVNETRLYICMATDPMPDNVVEKRSVDDLREETLRYPSDTSILAFTQHHPIDSKCIRQGFISRFLAASIFPKEEAVELYRKRLFVKDIDSLNAELFADFLNSISKQIEFWTCDYEAEELLVEYSELLLASGYSGSEKGARYTIMMEQRLLDLMIKFSCIIAGSFGRCNVIRSDVELAYHDLYEVFGSHLQWINFVKGDISVSTPWQIDKKTRECYEWLYNQGGITEEDSKVTVSQFVEAIHEIYGYPKAFDAKNLSNNSSYKKYMNLRKQNLIQSKQVGTDSSRVWMVERDIDFAAKGCKGGKAKSLFLEIGKKYSYGFSKNPFFTYPKENGQPFQPLSNEEIDKVEEFFQNNKGKEPSSILRQAQKVTGIPYDLIGLYLQSKKESVLI